MGGWLKEVGLGKKVEKGRKGGREGEEIEARARGNECLEMFICLLFWCVCVCVSL